MREIKFRAWIKSEKTMASSMRLNRTEILGVDLATIDDNLILMQYTGLHDKNGKEIYEGDILIFSGDYVIVKWKEKQARFVIVSEKYNRELGLTQPEMKYNNARVISTLYEHPELLKL